MLPEGLPFRVIRVNSEDEVIARASNLIVGRAAYETACQALSEGPDLRGCPPKTAGVACLRSWTSNESK